MKKVLSVLLCLALLLACSSLALADDKPLKVALIVTGKAQDGGWNQCAYDGLQLLINKYNVEYSLVEDVAVSDVEAHLISYGNDGYDIVFGHSQQYGEYMLDVAEMFPDTKYIAIEGTDCNGANMGSYQLKCAETAYVIGTLAAKTSASQKILMVSSFPGPSMNKIVNGYYEAAKAVNPDIEVLVQYTNSYTDLTVAKEIAENAINSGVDFIYHCANAAGDPALVAGAEHKLPVVGDSYDQSWISAEYIQTSAQYNVDKLMEKAYNDIVNGTFDGSVVEGGMADGVVALVYGDGVFNPSVPAELQAELNDMIAKITSGELVIVGNPNDLIQ